MMFQSQNFFFSLQLHAKLKEHSLPDFTLRWIQTDGQTFIKEQEEEDGPSVFF